MSSPERLPHKPNPPKVIDTADYSKLSDDELLRQAGLGNNTAFSEFCVRSIPTISRYLHWFCKNNAIPTDTTDDLVQDTLAKAIQFISAYVGYDVPKLSRGWLLTIAHNAAVDWLRKNRRMKYMDPATISQIPTKKPEHEVRRLEHTLDKFSWLKSEDQEILELVLLKELTFGEAAAELDLGESAAKKRYYRALERLRDLMDVHGPKE